MRYLQWLGRHPGPRLELTKASHGAGLVGLAAASVYVCGPSIREPVAAIPAAIVAAWGALWFVTSGLAVRR